MNVLARLAAAVVVLASLGAQAGGPLSICDDAAKTPLVYANPVVNLHYDLGNLGLRTKLQADAIVTNAVALWTNVPTATIAIGRGPDLPVDVTSANYTTYLYTPSLNNVSVFGDGRNPVVYDTDGSIIDLMLGTGAKSHVLGFAGSAYSLAPTCRYAEGSAVINGFLSISDNTLTVVLAHEIGHFIGLDHTQLDNTQGLSQSNYALMYPIASRTLLSLHEDDAAAVSALYPDVTLNSVYGQISGTFVLANGVTPVLGANLWAKETTTNKVYSVVSDYLTQGTGYFKLLLPAGTYNLRAEAIDLAQQFTGDSSVGPYSEDASQPSFQPPLYSGLTPMPTLTLGNGTPTAFTISAGCAATLTFRFDGTGTVGGNCANTPASMVSPTPGTSLSSATQLFTWNNASASLYQITVGNSLGATDIAVSPTTGSTSVTVANLPTDGRTLYVRLYSQFNGIWYSRNYTYIAQLPPPAAITSPAPGTLLAGSSQLFTWNSVAGASLYQVAVGNTFGASDIGAFPATPTASTSTTATGLPIDGRTLYVRLYTNFAGVWYLRDYTYTAFLPTPASMTSPGAGTQLASATQLFTWNSAVGASLYQITVGNSLGATDIGIFPPGGTASTSISATGLPTDGRTLHVRLYSQLSGIWYSRDYTYTAFLPPPASMTSPGAGTQLASVTQLFTWNSVAGASLYQVTVGSSLGATDIGIFPPGGTAATSISATGLPNDGRTLYVRLYSQFHGVWYFRDYTYTAYLPPPAAMIAPVPSTTLPGASQTFTWNDVGASQYRLWVGNSLGANDAAESPVTTAGTSMLVTRLPADGRTLYVRLSSKFGATFYSRDYTYTASAATGTLPSTLVSPAAGSILAGSTQLFTWADTGALQYQLWVGSTFGSYDIGYGPNPPTTATSTTISGIPTDGRMLFVRVYSNIGGTWVPHDYTYVASSVTPVVATPAVMSSPLDGSTLSNSTQTFAWNNSGAAAYKLSFGTTAGAANLGEYPSAAGTAGTSIIVDRLPINGNPLFVRLSSMVSGVWVFTDYAYVTPAPVVSGPASLVSPVPNAGVHLAGASQLFTWSNSGATAYQVWVGNSYGSYDIGYFPAMPTSGTSATASGLPLDGRVLFVRLYSLVGGVWVPRDYTYFAAP